MYKTIFAKQKAKINLPFHERTPWTSEQGRGLLLFEVNLLMTEDERKTNDLPLRLLEANDKGSLAVKCDVAMAEHILCGQYKGQPFFAFGDTIIKKNDAEKPAWCLCRTKNWRLVRLIEACGIRCFPSSEIIRITSDKGLICIYACAEDVKQPDTILKFPTTQCVPTIDYPAIIKGCYGNCGKAVYYATDELGVFKALGEIGYESEILLQQCMPSGDDVRVFILCGEIIGAQKRFQGQGDFRSNIRFGGRDELIVLNDEQRESVQKVIAMLPGNPLETGFICADFLFDDKGNFVLGECNSMPEIKRLRGEKDYEKLECRIVSTIDSAAKALEQQNRLYC